MRQKVEKMVTEVMNEVDSKVDELTRQSDRLVDPYRKSVLKRYPTLFLMLVAFGVTATLFGFERIIQNIPWLNDRPLLILVIGVVALAFTGNLYKKLG